MLGYVEGPGKSVFEGPGKYDLKDLEYSGHRLPVQAGCCAVAPRGTAQKALQQ